ncbi:hypothetical protein HOU03_gp356 [Caulobacter phage CcrSC]|uniref:Uncharacterized protein n=1 Tax=Caulobacter phage CcrSC TaxID=2283272 RepID=A0A385EG51_9CAUD|nr:hypothetical protein HOU03_gp356 [Caulobacter phage CcrSC]AXQ69912.1 hypothetical protein CcrSC_gp330 [Caulobacter phage CcrSC]
MAGFHVICRREGRERDHSDFPTLAQAKSRALRYAEREAMIAGIYHEPAFQDIKAQIEAFKPGCFKGVQVGEVSVVRIEDRS